MARKWVVALVGLILVTALCAAVKSPAFDAVLVYIHPAASTHGEKWTSPVVAGGATVDTVRIWRGAARGIAHDDTLLVFTGLDTSATWRLDLTIKTQNQSAMATYALNMALVNANVDTSRSTLKFNFNSGNCSGTTGTDGFFNVCGYTTGATGSLEFENRIYTAWSADVVWTLTGGNP